jgi:hypothetical protein
VNTNCPPQHVCSAGGCVAVLPSPAEVSAVPGARRIDLSWAAVPGASSYAVSAALQEQPPQWVTQAEVPGTYVALGDLQPDTTFYFVVQAVNGLGPGVPSAPVRATTATESLQVRGAGTSLVLTWGTVAPDPRFDVSRATSPSGPFELVAPAALSPWADQDVGEGQTRWYRVRPASGGADSKVASGTTRPPAPAGLSGTSDSSGNLILSWHPAAAARTYFINGTTREGSTFSRVSDGTSAIVQMYGGGPARYTVTVSASNDAGQSGPSPAITGLTAPAFVSVWPGPGRTHINLGYGGGGEITVGRATSPDGPWTPFATAEASVYTFEIVDPAPPSWAPVWYRAQAADAIGPGDISHALLETTYGAPDLNNAALFSGSGCERWASFDTVHVAEQGFTPGATGTLMGLQASVSLEWAGASVEAHVLDLAGNDLGKAVVPSIGSCPQPLSENVPYMYADLSASGIHVDAGRPLRLQLRVLGPSQAYAWAGITPDAYPGDLVTPDPASLGNDLILRTFVRPDPPPQGAASGATP